MQPDFTRFEAAVTRDRLPDRLPSAEVEVDLEMMEAFLGRGISDLRDYCCFWERAGYDYVPLQVRGQWLSDSFQKKVADNVRSRPDAESASTFGDGGAFDEAAYEAYPWTRPEDVYYKDVDLIEHCLPEGMKLIVNVGPLFSGTWRCMGLENFAIACVERPEIVRAVVEKTGGLLVTIVTNVVQRDYVGGIWLGDDIAYTGGLMAAPHFLRTHIFPFYRDTGELCRRYGKLFLYHSDGVLADIFEDLIDCGIQAIHPNEPTSVDVAELKRELGDRLAFLGGVDVDVLTRGTPEQVAAAARRLIRDVAPGGGFALGSGNSVTRHMPLANYRAMLDAVQRYGDMY